MTTATRRLEDWLAAPMFGLATLFLALLAVLFHSPHDPEIERIESRILLASLAVLWPLFGVEAVARYLTRPASQKGFARVLLDLVPAFLPPLRLGVRSIHDPQCIWLPRLGWQPTGHRLLDFLQRTSGAPMIVAALFILPLMVLEFGFEEQVRTYAALGIILQLGTGFIWFAFAFEFIVLASAAPQMSRYFARHWLDFAIVILPVIEFLPFLRLLRLTRLARLDKLGRLYRLRGLAMKAWRAILLLNVINRMLGQSTEKRLIQLRNQLMDKQAEIEILLAEIEKLEESSRLRAEAESAQTASKKPVESDGNRMKSPMASTAEEPSPAP